MRIHVKGGTNAGWKIMRPQMSKDWTCPTCGARNRYYWTTCPVDGTRRPEKEA